VKFLEFTDINEHTRMIPIAEIHYLSKYNNYVEIKMKESFYSNLSYKISLDEYEKIKKNIL